MTSAIISGENVVKDTPGLMRLKAGGGAYVFRTAPYFFNLFSKEPVECLDVSTEPTEKF